jgi:hypothetical protein
VYEEAKRGIVQQQAVLNGVRTRAATLLGVASISTSFLVEQLSAIKGPRVLAELRMLPWLKRQ